MTNFKNYLLIAIFSLMSFVAGLTISEAKASINKFNSIENVNRVSYDFVYVNGTKYIIFTNGTDIEVVK